MTPDEEVALKLLNEYITNNNILNQKKLLNIKQALDFVSNNELFRTNLESTNKIINANQNSANPNLAPKPQPASNMNNQNRPSNLILSWPAPVLRIVNEWVPDLNPEKPGIIKPVLRPYSDPKNPFPRTPFNKQ